MELLNEIGYTFKAIQPLYAGGIPQECGILITHANRVPPHIGFCQNGIYYSLSQTGKSKPESLGTILRLIDLKKIPSLFVRLQEPVFRPSQDGIEHLLYNTPSFELGGSCLLPVKSVIEEYWNIQVEKPLIHGLMEHLEASKLIRETGFRHLDPVSLQLQKFTIPFYDEVAVRNHLLKLISGS